MAGTPSAAVGSSTAVEWRGLRPLLPPFELLPPVPVSPSKLLLLLVLLPPARAMPSRGTPRRRSL